MNKKLILLSLFAAPLTMFAQGATDAYQLSQPDLKGTARFMSMGGAFGALGGDLTTLSQNPAGVGVYRKQEVGITLDLDCQSITTKSPGYDINTSTSKVLMNNGGFVLSYNMNNDVMQTFNFGFTYNRGATFNKHYKGQIGNLQTSLSNYIAGVANNDGAVPSDLESSNTYDPYNSNTDFQPSWLTVLGYQGFLITPYNPNAKPGESANWQGQFGYGTTGTGVFDVYEKGGIDEYNLAFGGNISDIVYWGMNFGIIDMTYSASTAWGESLSNAYVDGQTGQRASWNLDNFYRVDGTGFNYKIGLIIKPIQALRLGIAVHTPTWYNLNEKYMGGLGYNYPNLKADNPNDRDGYVYTNNKYEGVNTCRFTSPWSFIVSAAGVIGNKLIVSADYQWTSYSTMHYSEGGGYGWGSFWDNPLWDDPYYDWWYKPGAGTRSLNDTYHYTNSDIKSYYTKTSTLRLGAEVRVTPQFSLRAGYAFSTSPVKESVRNNQETIYTVGTTPQYSLDNTTTYLTAGAGYKYKKFYVDAAYVYKHRTSTYHAFTPDPGSGIQSPQADVVDNRSQIVLSMGFKF